MIMKKIVSMTVVMLLTATLASASYQKALELFEKQEYKESLKMIADELETANDVKPDSPNFNLRFLAAHNHWKLGNTKSAADHFTRCIAIRKKSVDPYIDLAMLQIEMKKYGEAENTARKGLEIEKSAELFYIMGLSSLKRGNFWRAKEMFEKANSLNPELYYSYNALGVALMRLKKYGEANTAFSAAHAIRPKSAEIMNNLGMSCEYLGKIKEAKEYYESAPLDEKNQVITANLERIKSRAKAKD